LAEAITRIVRQHINNKKISAFGGGGDVLNLITQVVEEL